MWPSIPANPRRGPMLGWCWASVVNDGPMSAQHWADAPCYLNFDDPQLLVSISGYPRYLTSFLCMTFIYQGQSHGGNDLGWVGAWHLFLNFDDPRLLVLIYGYLRSLTSFFCRPMWPWDLRVNVNVGMTLDGWAPGTCILILMIHDFYF